MFRIAKPYPYIYFDYAVKPGDTMYAIAKRFNTTVYLIQSASMKGNPDLIIPGQTLRIPVSPPGAIVYTIKTGDTLNLIAAKYNTSVQSIIALNFIIQPDQIYPGQQLVLVP